MRKPGVDLVLFLAIAIFAVVEAAPEKPFDQWTLEDVVLGIADANGGLESIESVTNARFMGRVEGSESSHEFVIIKRRPNLIRSRLIMENRVLETGFDGKVAWRRLEVDGLSRVEPVEDPEFLASLRLEADFDGPLIGPVSEGVTRRLTGIERIDRVDHFVIEVRRPAQVARHYIDTRTLREMQVIRSLEDEIGNPLEIVARFHDIKNYNGIWVAMRVEKQFSNGQSEVVLMDSVEMNLGILDFSFKMRHVKP